MPWADSSTICARRQVTHQARSLVIIDLTHPQPIPHQASPEYHDLPA